MSEIDNSVAALATDSHNLGEFKTVYDAMKKYPNGGVVGDYITILGVQHFWNVNRASWGILKDKEDNIVQMVEDMVGNFTNNGYMLVGIAIPETVPVNISNAFYIATVPGEYVEFGVTLKEYHVYFLKNTAAGWVSEDTGIVNQPLVEITDKPGNSETKVMNQKSVTGLFNEGHLFVGVATPDITPVVPQGNVFYIASDKGIYTAFGNIELDGSVLYIFKYSNGAWVSEKTNIPIDPELVVSNAEKDAKEAKKEAKEAKEAAENAEKTANASNDIAAGAKKTADLSLAKSTNNEKLITAANEKVDDLGKTLTDTTQKATEALGLAKGAIKTSDRGMPNGVPILDGSGKIPQSQLPLTKTELVDSYESDSLDKAPTAAALHRAFTHHAEDMVTISDKLEAILDFVSDSTELGVSPTQINITSEAQTVRAQIICNGEWTVKDVPSGVTVSPLRGTGRGSITIDFSANSSTEADVNGVFTISNSYGKEKAIHYTQYSASTRYVYDLIVTPASIEVSALPGSGHFDVLSTKTPYINDTPTGEPETVGYTLSIPEGISWMRLTTARSTEQYEYDENLLEASRSVVMTITQEGAGGKTIEIPFNQAKATTYTEFKFSITPTGASIDDNGAGGVYPAKITSTKTVTINGNESTSEMPYTISYEGDATSAWVVVDSDAITLPINNNELSRSGAVVFTQEGVEANIIRVPIVQAAATIAWNYVFTINPLEIKFGNAAGNRTFEVSKCTKKKTVNGVEVGDEIQVAWDVSLVSDIFVLNKETNTISAPENTAAERTAELIFTRPELGADDRKVIRVIQEAGVVTWEYTLEASANPTSIAALNGTTVLTVNSSKQKYINGIATGSPIAVEWHGTSTNGYLSGADQSGATWTMQENQTESSRVDSIIINQLEEGGKSKTLNFTQVAGTITYEYTFNVLPTSITLNNAGVAQSVNVTSVRQKKINGNNVGGVENVDWSSSISNGFSINGASIGAPQNNTESVKNGTATFSQTGSGRQVSVNVSQEAGTVTWEYTFNVSPTSLNFVSTGDTQSVSVTSYKRKYINGNYTGVQENVGFSSSASGDGFSSAGTSVSIGNNTTILQRSGTVTFVQYESGKPGYVSCQQAGGTETTGYSLSILPSGGCQWSSTGTGMKIIDVEASYYRKVNGVIVYREAAAWDFELDTQARFHLDYVRMEANGLALTPRTTKIFKGEVRIWVTDSPDISATRYVRRV